MCVCVCEVALLYNAVCSWLIVCHVHTHTKKKELTFLLVVCCARGRNKAWGSFNYNSRSGAFSTRLTLLCVCVCFLFFEREREREGGCDKTRLSTTCCCLSGFLFLLREDGKKNSIYSYKQSPVEPASSLPITLNGFSLSRPISCGATNCGIESSSHPNFLCCRFHFPLSYCPFFFEESQFRMI